MVGLHLTASGGGLVYEAPSAQAGTARAGAQARRAFRVSHV